MFPGKDKRWNMNYYYASGSREKKIHGLISYSKHIRHHEPKHC
jgi:hypothetical protein